ncbi:MAG TPA: potassium transporter KefA, partial [Eubacteriaceae bacterium]|nr:potassium transporter KefA [Eubacteriaceae bacterium]
MNYGIVVKILGYILIIKSILLLPSTVIAFSGNESSLQAFLITLAASMLTGIALSLFPAKNRTIKAKEGLGIVTFGWIIVSVFGALPLFLSGSVPTYIDALFETISGFTTTGASLIENVEILPKSILFWRSFTHWIGGMGILVFTIALIPALGIGGLHIYKAESPGPVAGKIVPRIKDTARTLYFTYFTLTFTEFVLLLFAGMNLFDASVYTFATVGTGGFGVHSDSIGGFPTSIHLIITVFMILAGISFSLYFLLYQKKYKDFLKDPEFKLYLKIIGFSVVFIALNLFFTNYGTALLSLRDAFFQVGSIMTTTGFSTADFDLWPTFSKIILVLLMFIGGSAGSTAGGMKVIRILIILKLIKREMSKMFHPRAYVPIKLGKKTLSNEVIARTNSFLALHLFVFIIGTLLISLEGIDLISATTSVAATLNNIGPGLGLVGPMENYV